MQHATAGNDALESALPRSVAYPQGQVLFQLSVISRSLMWREVTNLPSLPKNGRVVDRKQHTHRRLVDSDRASGLPDFQNRQIVSPISNPSIPTIAHISPASTSSTFMFFQYPRTTCKSLIRLLISCHPVSLCQRVTGHTGFQFSPVSRLPIAIRPI